MENKVILISCWAKPLRSGAYNAKNPSKEWWGKVVKSLKEKGYIVWQCGQGPEMRLKQADRHLWDMDLWALGEQIKNCNTWISVDNFFPHWALLQFGKPGIVIWGQSDPFIFGHEGNVNILKSESYLRERQFEMWEAATYNAEAFVEPQEVIDKVEEIINTKGEGNE